MRNIFKFIILSLLAVSFLPGCSSYLDKDPLSDYAGDAFWVNENNAKLALNGIYRGGINNALEYEAYDWWSYGGLIWPEAMSDNAYDRRGDNSVFNVMTNGTKTNTATVLGWYWTRSYARVARCQDLLENIDKVSMDESKKNRMKAETRFIRACQYFYLSQFYGSVPLVTKSLTPEEANVVEKASKDQIVKFVSDELSDIVQYLPRQKDLPAAERGRATQQAALAFLGRLQMAEKKWSDAANTYKTIVDFGDNIIDPKYKSLFDGTNEISAEIIFATQHLVTLANNSMQQHFAPLMLSGWSVVNPYGALMECYDFKDGTPFSYTDPRYSASDLGASQRDPRLGYTIFYTGSKFKGLTYVSHPDSASSPDQMFKGNATKTGYGLAKYTSESHTGDLQTSGIDIPVIRYAEVLLSYLESKLESGAAIDQALLDATINKVRARADVNMPSVTETNPDRLRDILRNERRVELALEGIRLWDLFRWRTAHVVMQGNFYGAPFPGAKTRIDTTDPYSRPLVTKKAFRENSDYVWEIPLSQQNINPNLRE